MKYVERIPSKGRVYYYYRRAGKRWPIEGEPASPEFLRNYQRLHNKFGGQRFTQPGTFHALSEGYLGSGNFDKLADGTKRNYRRHLDFLRNIFGPENVTDIRRADCLDLMDELKHKPGRANNVMDVLHKVLNWALDREWIETNPAARIERYKMGEHQPWTQAEIDIFREGAKPEMLWAVELALYTGQRRGDCLAMRWDKQANGLIEVIQEKGRVHLRIPIHPRLAEVLSAIPKKSLTILHNAYGRPWKTKGFENAIRRELKRLGVRKVFHGLRKTAAVNLAEAGCSEREIMAITGHQTSQMVDHYVKAANQKNMAKAAIEKLKRTPDC
jgi:integrase